jgi:hypothetical protein
MKAGTARALLTGGLALGLLLASAPAASGYHHVMVVSEVNPGDAGMVEEEFVELQMYAAGQNLLSGLHVRLYDSAGDEVYEDEFAGTVPNGSSQATVLAGVASFNPDLAFAANPAGYLNPSGGAACITSDVFSAVALDCVAWGSFDDDEAPFPVLGTGTNEAEIPDAFSISRTHTRGCPTLLEGVDDSNDSDADFSATVTTGRNNAAPITETPCTPPPGTGGSTTPATPGKVVPPKKKRCKKPKKRSAGATAKKCKKKK